MTSLYFPDFEPGQTFLSTGRTVTEADLTMFSMLSGDWNPVHADVEYCRHTRYGQRLVHGVFAMAMATGLMHQLGIFEHSVVAMLGFREWRFLKPIFVGDTLRLELSITEKELGRTGATGRIGRRFRLLNQSGEVVQEGLSDVLVRVAPLPEPTPASAGASA